MQLGRYQVSTLRPAPILSITFSKDGRFFAVASETGYEVWRSWPLGLVRRRVLPGTLARVLPLPCSPLLVLQGGGRAPLYPPNKAVVYHDGLGTAVAELEFGERIRGIDSRAGTICIALSRRVVAFEYGLDASGTASIKGKGKADSNGFWLRKIGEWETAENENGLLALSTTPGSTLLALPGRQAGHVQLVHLPPCPSSPSSHTSSSQASHLPQLFRSPIILAHTHSLSALACTASGSHLITTSERGTLVRVWDTSRGRLERELRRGVDRAEMWGVVAERDLSSGGRVVGWSDKGTVHIWGNAAEESSSRPSTPLAKQPSLTHMLSRNLPLPKYFSSTASTTQYHLPRKNPHAFSSDEAGEWAERFVVGWVEVEIEVNDDKEKGDIEHKKHVKRWPGPGGEGGGIGMGTREERRSFGSDATSTRTATPTFRVDTPSDLRRRSSGLLSARDGHLRSTSGSKLVAPSSSLSIGKEKSRPRSVKTIGESARKTKTERQLVAITYSGDWYRLRIPDGDEQDDDNVEGKKKGKCELVEYRRLGVGGGGW